MKMPPPKKAEIERQAWSFIETVSPEDIQREQLESAYRLTLKKCKNCKRNCSHNPKCLTGLGEEKYKKSLPAKAASLESSLTELRNPPEYVGLENLGATCYVNSLIQVWFHNEELRRIIYKWNSDEDPDEHVARLKAESSKQTYVPSTVIGQLQFVFAMLQFGNKKRFDPYNLAIVLQLDTSTQQDAQEFSKLLLCHIEDKLQTNSELLKSLQKLTQGKYVYINCCTACGTEHPTSTTFYELDLQLASTLKEALQKYLSEEKLTGANQYFCTNCNDKRDARRFIRLASLPDTLNIQLLRFVFNRSSNQKKKLNSFIQFPEVLDMSEYLNSPPQTHVYNLVAVLSHKGPHANSGHYSANICNSEGEWYQFSDEKVEKINHKRMEDETADDLKTKRGKVPKGFISSNTAYMLVYKRVRNCETNSNDDNSKETNDQLRKGKRKVTNDGKSSALGSSTSSPKKFKQDKSDDDDVQIIADYKALNGDAHRTMSCTKRDALDEVEFDRWEVSKSLREIVKEENVRHELTLLDIQEKKKQEIEEQNKKRELVIQFYEMVKASEDYSEYQWVPTDWLNKWLTDKTSSDQILPIDNSDYVCSHGKLDLSRISHVKCLPVQSAELLFKEYGHKLKLDHNSLCDICVKRKCKLLKFKKDVERDHKRVNELLRNFKEITGNCFIVGADSLKSWHRLAESQISVNDHNDLDEKMDQNMEECITATIKDPDHVNDDTEIPARDVENTQKELEECEDNNIINFNEDLLCEHHNLSTRLNRRKVVPQEAWEILRKYFPDSKEYPANTPACPVCEASEEQIQKIRADDKINAKKQKEVLMSLYNTKKRNITDFNVNDQLFIISKEFIDLWRRFIRSPDKKGPPQGIQNEDLLCSEHHGFLYDPQIPSDAFTIISEEEWTKLSDFYNVDYRITAIKCENHESSMYITNPEVCDACINVKREQEKLESLKYDRATIYIRFLDDNEDKSENDEKKYKTNSSRPTRTRRKDHHELKVSSSMTLKDLKVMVINFCGAPPLDQHLIFNNAELTDDEKTLEAYKIYPEAILILKVDTAPESGSDVEGDAANADPTSPEKGFKGTELIR